MGRAFGTGIVSAILWSFIGVFTFTLFWLFLHTFPGPDEEFPFDLLMWLAAFLASAGFAIGWGTGMKGVRRAFKTIGFSLAIAPVLSLITILPLYGIVIDSYSARSEKLSPDDWLAFGILYAGLTAVFVLIAILAYFGDLTKPRKKR